VNTLFLLDPALTFDEFDHHYCNFKEVSHTCRDMQIDLHVLASAWCKTSSNHRATPFFKSQTYYFFESMSDFLSRFDAINTLVHNDYAEAHFGEGARILMQTASPWHLLALAERLDPVNNIRLAVGLMLPSSFWTKDPELQILLDEMTAHAIRILERKNLFLFSETGYAKPSGHLPLCVPTMSNVSLRLCKKLANQQRRDAAENQGVTFGFFGGLFEHKGVDLILEAAKSSVANLGYRVVFFVPPHHQSKIASLNLSGIDCVKLSTSELEYESYLTQIGSVSAVLCCYDRAFYSEQMSGIVTEAAALGVPTIVTRGTTLHRFLLTYSPGAGIPIEYDPASLAAVLALPHAYWEEKRKCALMSASLVQELKSCRRFLSIALGL
jgi:glycosyltransferase involved in cell wall biosynthesis